MRTYRQLTSEERYALAALRRQGFSCRRIARSLGRSHSTISREVRRNLSSDGAYRPKHAQSRTHVRRSASRRNRRFAAFEWAIVEYLLRTEQWSPEQIAGRLALHGVLSISHETIYTHIWADKQRGGTLHTHLRQAGKQRRKRYRSNDSRGRLRGKKMIEERPVAADERAELGHLEGDTVMGGHDPHCILTLVDRRSGFTTIGKLPRRSVDETNRVLEKLLRALPFPVRSLTLDNGTEFHGYKDIEEKTGVPIYFATPHHSWERGTNENTNGLIRQYLPKRTTMKNTSQRRCQIIADRLNRRPRKRLGYKTPTEVLNHEH